MEYTAILNALNNASAFDLFRLHVAIGNELDNPKHVMNVKQCLRLGMETTFFCCEENREIAVRIIGLKPRNVIAELIANPRQRFKLPYYVLNIGNRDTSINEGSGELSANNLSVGEIVEFVHKGVDIIGMIEKLNQKTVSLTSTTGGKWRVGYSCLHRVHDSEAIREEFMKLGQESLL